MVTIHTMAALEDALANGYDLKFSAVRGWLLVSAEADSMRVSVKVSCSKQFRDKYIPKRSLDESEYSE